MANYKEAKARIKINKLLEQAGWRFFDLSDGEADNEIHKNTLDLLWQNTKN
jgi:type I restriction enzyme R subunit